MYQNTIGNRIRDLRVARNMTQAELGRVVGVSMQAVSKWERGGIPDIGVLMVLADYFRVTLDELMGRRTADECSLNDSLYNSILKSPPEEAFELACGHCWSAVKGVTGIPSIEALGYSASQSTNPENSRCRISTNEGIAYGIITEDTHMVSIMPEPVGGFASVMGEFSEYAELFRFLGDEDTLKLFQFIGTRSHTLFSKALAMQETGVSEEKTDRIFANFLQRGWLTTETADTNQGLITLYRSFFRESFLFFQIYARELMVSPRFWYLSSISRRTKPLLNTSQP